MASSAVLDPLRVFLSGKRSSARLSVDLPVRLGGRLGPLDGGTVDVSAGGALLYLPLGALGPVEGAGDLFARVEANLGGGFDLRFAQAGVVLESEVVRLVMPPDDPSHLYLGVRFPHAPTPAQLAALGLGGRAPEADASLPLEALPLVPRPGRRTRALLCGRAPGEAESWFQGEAVALGARALGLRLERAPTADLSRWLGAGPMETILFQAGLPVWRSPADLLAVRCMDRPSGTVEAGLLLAGAPPRRVRRAFRRR